MAKYGCFGKPSENPILDDKLLPLQLSHVKRTSWTMYVHKARKNCKKNWGTCDDSVCMTGRFWLPWSACRHGSCSSCRASSPGQSLSSMSSLGSSDVQPFVHHAKNQCRKLQTNIPRKGIAGPQSQFPHSYVCERFIYSHHRSAYSAAGKYADRSWEYINQSQTHECGNWDWDRALPRKGIHKWYLRRSAPVFRILWHFWDASRSDLDPRIRTLDFWSGSGSGSCSFRHWLSRWQQKWFFLLINFVL